MTDARRIALPAYVVALALLLIPIGDVAVAVFPWRMMEPRWRFGATGVVSNALLLPLAGLLIGFVVSVIAEHRLIRKLTGVTGLLAAMVCVLLLVVFGLDAVQTRAAVRPEMRAGFATAAIGAAFKICMATVVFGAVAYAALARQQVRLSAPGEIPLFSGTSARARDA